MSICRSSLNLVSDNIVSILDNVVFCVQKALPQWVAIRDIDMNGCFAEINWTYNRYKCNNCTYWISFNEYHEHKQNRRLQKYNNSQQLKISVNAKYYYSTHVQAGSMRSISQQRAFCGFNGILLSNVTLENFAWPGHMLYTWVKVDSWQRTRLSFPCMAFWYLFHSFYVLKLHTVEAWLSKHLCSWAHLDNQNGHAHAKYSLGTIIRFSCAHRSTIRAEYQLHLHLKKSVMWDCLREFTLFSEARVRSSLTIDVLYTEAPGWCSSQVMHLSNMLAAWLWDTGHTYHFKL